MSLVSPLRVTHPGFPGRLCTPDMITREISSHLFAPGTVQSLPHTDPSRPSPEIVSSPYFTEGSTGPMRGKDLPQ